MRYFILLLSIALIPATSLAGDKFQDLAQNCKAALKVAESAQDDPIKEDIHALLQAEKCWTYLNSFQEALAWVAIKNAEKDQADNMQAILKYLPFCIPNNVTIKQQAIMIINYAERNPAHAKWPAGVVFGELMIKQYPCKTGN